ncbi:hypothetical protein KA089_00830 [Candidatus Woesebacteria bacterium]|nr:hypothetical protein [Candidatus Woesebacteria bacterium]
MISFFIGLQNTSIRSYYSGWDNIHAEFDIAQYAKRVFFGAWQEHKGLGGPSAKGHLSEITRLPIIYLIDLILPAYLVRSTFIMLMYATGGVGMYLYLKKIWIKDSLKENSKWIAGLGSLLYLLHPLTLQQFYISFEIFTVQFAFFPFLILSIHLLLRKITWKSILIFMIVQLALAPSAHTPTVHYLGVLFSLIYSFFSALDSKKIFSAFKFMLFIGLLTMLMNAYWILPNLYYGLHNSRYVSQSEANVLFGPESLWSIRDSSTLHSFLTGFHYLTTWRDYDFKTEEHQLIFNEWSNHLKNPFRNMQLYTIGIFSILGFFITIFNKRIGKKRWAIVIIYLICISLIWIDLFPTNNIILQLYKSKTFLETFRNPFTKLSILYSFFLIVLIVEFLKLITVLIENKLNKKVQQVVLPSFLLIFFVYIISITSPIFSGHLISEKLKVIFPPEYEKLYSFMKTKDSDMRTLEMPYISREGWVLYDWSTPNRTNAYQGIGFYFFGFPQPFLTPDFARWSEVNDFFYQELQYAIDKNDFEQFKQITKKYNIPLAIVDESRVYPYKDYDFQKNYEMLENSGYKKIWQEKYISVYENVENTNFENSLIIPKKLSFISADFNRVKKDVAFPKIGEYININKTKEVAKYIFPFSSLLLKETPDVVFSENEVTIKKSVAKDNYLLEIPGNSGTVFDTTLALQLKDGVIFTSFPKNKIITNNENISLSYIENSEIKLDSAYSNYSIFVNGKVVELKENEIQYLPLNLIKNKDQSIIYSSIDGKVISETDINWEQFEKNISLELSDTDEITIKSTFQTAQANLSKIPSENCTKPLMGDMLTTYENKVANYEANNYGVNCNTLDINFISPSSSYLLNIDGENFAGRSTKMFINYSVANSIQEEHLFPESKFNITIPLDKISENPQSRFFVNWETRSFGKYSNNKINSIQVFPFALEKFSEISLTRIDGDDNIKNNIEVISSNKKLNFLYNIKINCPQECYFGIDQAHDDLWIAYDKNNHKILPHFTYNNWANLWRANENSEDVVIVYLPQFGAFLGMIAIPLVAGYLIVYGLRKMTDKKSFENEEQLSKKIAKHPIRSKTKKVFRGKN